MLVEAGIFIRKAYQQNPPRFEYILTEKARGLFPLVMILRQWAMTQNTTTEHLCHKACGHPLALDVICGACKQPVAPQDVMAQR